MDMPKTRPRLGAGLLLLLEARWLLLLLVARQLLQLLLLAAHQLLRFGLVAGKLGLRLWGYWVSLLILSEHFPNNVQVQKETRPQLLLDIHLL